VDTSDASAFELGTDGPRSIVVGVDGSDSSLRAGAYAAGLARRQGSRLTVVYARNVGGGATVAADLTGAATLARLEELDAIEAELRAELSRAVWDLDVAIDVRRGPAFAVIEKVADEVRAEAVVVGASRGTTFLMPSAPLAVQLIRTRRWPVVVVP
jgi:nucleotide-binding universal stress UspA family protein